LKGLTLGDSVGVVGRDKPPPKASGEKGSDPFFGGMIDEGCLGD